MADKPLISYPTCIRESLVVFDLLRNLGFKADDIFFAILTKEKPGYLRTALTVQIADDKFSVGTGWIKGVTGEQLMITWSEACEVWHRTTHQDHMSIIATSNTYSNKANTVALIMRLRNLGFISDPSKQVV